MQDTDYRETEKDRQIGILNIITQTEKWFLTVLPHSNGKMAAQNLGFGTKFLPMTFDILTVQRSNCLLSVIHMASGAQDNSYYQEVLSHPASYWKLIALHFYFESKIKIVNLKRM